MRTTRVMTLALALALTLAALAVGCNAGTGAGNDAAPSGSGGATGSDGGSGGSGGAGDAGDPTARFVGTWASVGSLILVCSDGTNSSQATPGQILITPGTTSDLLRATAGSACTFPLEITGDHADLAGVVICPVAADGNQVTVTAWRMTVNADGRAADETGTATIDVPAFSATCAGTFSTHLTR